jgi:hypothetical protein
VDFSLVDFSVVSSADFSFISVIEIVFFSSVHVSFSSGDVFLFFDFSPSSPYNSNIILTPTFCVHYATVYR